MTDVTAGERERVPFWLWPNVLGLDAPLVAVAWQHFFASAFRVKIPVSNYLALALVVWVIYSADRLLDALRLAQPGRAAVRHQFYRRRFFPMAGLTLLGAGLATFLVLTRLPENLVRAGSMVGVLVGVYFVHRLWARGPMLLVIPKEVFAGLVFAVGATLTGHAWTNEIPRALWSPEVLWFGCLCSLNCLAISIWERDSDAGNDPNALPQLWPGAVAHFPTFGWIAAAVAGGYALWNKNALGFPVFLAVAGGALLIALLATIADRLRPEVARALADLAVLMPALALLPMLPWVSTA